MKYACVVVLVLLLAAAACGGQVAPGTPTPGPSPTPTEVPTPSPNNGHGTIRADFTAEPTVLEGPTWVQFKDLSTGDVTEWAWDLNGDGKIDSTQQNPAFYFDRDGYYSVTLTVRGPGGVTDSKVERDYIQVSGCKT